MVSIRNVFQKKLKLLPTPHFLNGSVNKKNLHLACTEIKI